MRGGAYFDGGAYLLYAQGDVAPERRVVNAVGQGVAAVGFHHVQPLHQINEAVAIFMG